MKSLTGAHLGLLAASLLLAGTSVQAQDRDPISVYQDKPHTYLLGAVGADTLKFKGFSVDSPVLSVGMGAMVNDYFGMELRVGRSVDRTDYKSSRYALDHVFSAMATMRVPLWRFFYGQAYVGATNIQLMTIDPTGDKDHHETGSLSYGVSAGIRVLPRLHAAAGYTSYINKSDWKVQALEGSLQYLF